MTNFTTHALPGGEADVSASGAIHTIADGPSPCRRCLRNAAVGDALLLLSYNPFTVVSPYAGEGPIFVHADGCQPPRIGPAELSEQVIGRVLSIRSYDADGMMLDAEVIAGERLAERARELLTPDTAFLHAHFAGPGCFAFRLDPA